MVCNLFFFKSLAISFFIVIFFFSPRHVDQRETSPMSFVRLSGDSSLRSE
jgi:hypothetical protein